MATLALGIAGAAIGSTFGPLGAQLGFLAGSALGGALFGEKGPPPPTQDLKFSGATYGLPRPMSAAKVRIPGNYIWGPDKVAHETSAGKGGPDETITTFTGSFAVGFGESLVGESTLLQLWFHTKLVYDATASDQPVADASILEALTIYTGSETQMPDPTIVGIEGEDVTPAYRGERYIVLNNLDLTPYGGMWPNVSAVWAPSVPAFPFRAITDIHVPLDGYYINPVVPYLYTRPGYEAVAGSGDFNNALLISRDAAAGVGIIRVQNGVGEISPNPDGSGFWNSWTPYVYDAVKGSFHDATGMPITSVDHFPGTGGPSQQDYCFNPPISRPYDPVDGVVWDASVETPNNMLVAVSGSDVEAWHTRGALRVCWYSLFGAGSSVGSMTYNPTPSAVVGSIISWPTACRPLNVSLNPYAVYFIVQDADSVHGSGTAPRACRILDTGAEGDAEFLFDSNGDNTITAHSMIWDLTLNRLFAVGEDIVEVDPNTLQIKTYDLIESDGITHVVGYSNILQGVGRTTFSFSNAQSQRFTHGRFWTALAMWIDLDALRPRLDANDNVVYGDAIIEDHSANPWNGTSFRGMAYDSLTDSFWGTTSSGNFIFQYFLHRRAETSDAVTLAELVTAISERVSLTAADLDVTALTDIIDGYLLPSQTTGRAAIEQLMAAYAFDAVESGGKIKYVKRGGASAVTIPQSELAAHMADASVPPPYELSRALEQDLPREVNVQYYNLAAAYQQGSQRWRRVATPSVNVASVNVGLALTDDRAKQIAERLGWIDWLGRTSFKAQLPRKYAWLEPTDVITIGDAGHVIRLVKTNFDQAILDCEAVLEDASMYLSYGTGSSAPSPPSGPVITSPTQLVILDAPSLREADATPGIYLAASAFIEGGWTGAVVFRDNVQIMVMMNQAMIGRAATVLGGWSGVNMFDETNTVDITLTHAGMELSSATELAVLNGTNWAMLGGSPATTQVQGTSAGGHYPGPFMTDAIAQNDANFLYAGSDSLIFNIVLTGDQALINVIINNAVFANGQYDSTTVTDEAKTVLASYQAWRSGGAVVSTSPGAVSGEIFGFKNAVLLSPGQYRLSGLLRGRQGTEWAANATSYPHLVGQRFVLLDQNALRWVPGVIGDVGVQHVYKAVSIGSAQSISQTAATFATPLRPYCPVLSQAVKMPNDDFNISWVPRAIHNHEWMPGLDVPPDPTFKYYEVQVWNAALDTLKRTILTPIGDPETTSCVYTSAQQTTDFGSPQATIYFTVGQINSDWNYGTRRIARYPNTANALYI